MALQTYSRGDVCPRPPTVWATAPSLTTRAIDAINEVCAFVVRAPKSGDIRSVSFRCDVGTGATITIGIYQVTTTDGDPEDVPTAWAANTFITKAITTGDANDWINSGNFTADATVVKGDLLAICFISPGASAGNILISTLADVQSDFPYTDLFTGSWTKGNTAPNVLLHYSDGSVEIPFGCVAFGDTAAGAFPQVITINTTTTPDVAGALWIVRHPRRVNGAWFWGDVDGDCNVKLVTDAWDGASSGLLATGAIDANCRASAGAAIFWVEFDTTVTVAVNDRVRLIIEPTTTTSAILYGHTCADAAMQGAQTLGADFCLTTAKDPNDDTDWTDYDNASDGFRRPYMGFVFDGADDGVGGGGGVSVLGHYLDPITRPVAYR